MQWQQVYVTPTAVKSRTCLRNGLHAKKDGKFIIVAMLAHTKGSLNDFFSICFVTFVIS